MEYIEISKKTVEECITEACAQLMVTSDNLDYEVVSTGSTGFLGLNVKPAVIRARVKEADSKNDVLKSSNDNKNDFKAKEEVKKEESKKPEVVNDKPQDNTEKVSSAKESEAKEISYVYEHDFINKANEFLANVFSTMNMKVDVKAKYNQTDKILEIDLAGDEMGVLIGKRGQTLDSLQYLISLVVNRDSEDYIHVKVDTENYRDRRKATLENLAKNIAYKVRKNRQAVSLEPMNPYERRIIHSALQTDKYVTTHSEGEEPFRRVVVTLKK
ncbi:MULTISPECIES: RNA-binding cell elongation regulator Jag/EloR [unclassified Butyrivibrio]|uniref:RNA-binding cell elongation regulator Jag/EloR n=1 Tax=unclassified Butyrivibrio TaxID=2639466 RepID=UPI0003FD1461|nr:MULTISPECIES: RNA-binding cell elongation regulator Jag/EloR [unclassified Butyrivibrio]